MTNPNNRRNVLAGFGVLALAVVAAIAIWQPSYRNEEAAGAIGAVEKHRAPQIVQSDVILGNEQTRTQQAVLWGDFFQTATKLQSISAAYANAAENRQEVASAAQVAELENELANQFASKMTASLQTIELSAKQAGNTELAAKASAMLGQLAENKQLSAAQMEQLSSAFSQAAAQSKLAQKSVQTASEDLGVAVSQLKNNGELAAAQLEAASTELANVNLNAVSLENQAEYFSELQSAAEALESAATAKALVASQELAQAANKLQAAALENIEEATAANIEMASAFNELQSKLAANRENLAAAPCCGSRLAAFQEAFATVESKFQSQAASMIQAELASMEAFAENRQQYSRLAGAQHLEAKMVGSAALDNKSVFAMLANTEELQQAAAKLGAALKNAELANALQNEEQLAMKLNAFESRLQAKSN